MQVILLEKVYRLGNLGDEVNVKPGYARNYLLPQKKALRANKENRTFFEAQRSNLEAENNKRKKEAEVLAKKLEGKEFLAIRQASESGQLYGSVTARDVADLITAQKIEVTSPMIVLDQAIKELGVFIVHARLHPEVVVDVRVNVARSEDEAKAQAKDFAKAAQAESDMAQVEKAAAPQAKAASKKKEAAAEEKDAEVAE